MALTKVTGQVVNTSTDLTVGVLTATTATFTGNVSVGGTLTYEDVTNVDSVGLITARNGISVTGSNISVESSEDRLLYLKSTDANAYLTFEDTDSSSGFANRIGSVSDGLYFSTGGGGERARIDSSGNFGLGTASPTTKLEINGGTDNNIVRIVSTDANANIEFADNTTTSGCQIGANGDNLKFGISGTEKMRIDSSGRLLLGTTTEGQVSADDFTVAGSGDSGITIRSGSSSEGSIMFSDATSGTGEYEGWINYNHGSNFMRFFTNATERMRIDSSGRMGLGTASPSSFNSSGDDLVVSSSGATGITINAGTSDSSNIYFSDSGNSTQGQIRYFHSSDSMSFGVSGSDAMRIDSSGRLLVGTTSATKNADRLSGNALALVDVGASNYPSVVVTGYADANADAGPIIEMQKSRGASDGSMTVVANNDRLGSFNFLGSDGTNFIRAAEIKGQVDGTPGTNDMPGRLVFATSADGASSPTERLRIDSSGNLTLKTTSSAGKFIFQEGTSNAWSLDTNGANGYLRFYDEYNSSERMRIDSSGRLLLGTTTEGQGNADNFTIADSGNCGLTIRSGTSSQGNIFFSDGTSGNSEYDGYIQYQQDTQSMLLGTASTARATIDSSGRLLVGTDTSSGYSSARLIVNGAGTSSTGSGNIVIQRGLANSSISDDDQIGTINFGDESGYSYANIVVNADAGPGSDSPGRLVFSTTADGAASPTERVRITSDGYLKASNTGVYISQASYHEFTQTNNEQMIFSRASHASFTENMIVLRAVRASFSGYNFLLMQSGNGVDNEFALRGDGNAYADGSWNGGGADYAEFFEWSDGNANAEDRRGISVVLDGDKIREAVTGEEPIGVISGNPSVVGDADIDRWKGKYLRDDYGTYIQEDYEVEDDDGNTIVQQRRKLNPDYNPDTQYVSRENRPEWETVGLMGKLRIRKGQVTGTRWIKMRDVSDTVEEWLVR